MMKFSLFHEELFFVNFFIVRLKELFKESVNRQETSLSPFQFLLYQVSYVETNFLPGINRNS